MSVTSIVIEGLAVLTVVGQGMVLLLLGGLAYERYASRPLNWFSMIRKRIQRYDLWLALAVSSTALLGSLFYSEVMGFAPCKLCWYQRIALYPQVALFLQAIIIKDRSIFRYAALLSGMAAVIAAYHYYLQVFANLDTTKCSSVGYAASCTTKFVMHFGYITIPMMALTAAILIITFTVVSGQARKQLT